MSNRNDDIRFTLDSPNGNPDSEARDDFHADTADGFDAAQSEKIVGVKREETSDPLDGGTRVHETTPTQHTGSADGSVNGDQGDDSIHSGDGTNNGPNGNGSGNGSSGAEAGGGSGGNESGVSGGNESGDSGASSDMTGHDYLTGGNEDHDGDDGDGGDHDGDGGHGGDHDGDGGHGGDHDGDGGHGGDHDDDDGDDDDFVPCFTPGTVILTSAGERLVEDLRVGDKIVTRDNGLQEIRWIGSKPLNGRLLLDNPHLRPVLIRQGSLGRGLPERDMKVSPNHRMLVANEKTTLLFEEREVLVAAKHLVNSKGIQQVDTVGTIYVHMMFDSHEVILADGTWTESFQPGDYSLKGIGNAQRNEIFELFPELRESHGRKGYTAARRSLKRKEACLLS